MTFAYPWALAIPLLFLIVRYVSRPVTKHLNFPSYTLLEPLPISLRVRLRPLVLFLLAFLGVCLLSAAAARPQLATVIDNEKSGRNIVLVIDASRSMLAQDFPTQLGHASRMEGIKLVVSQYVRSRTQDRIALVVFGNSAYLQSPLTSDTALVEELVSALRPGMAGDGTAIGDGLGLGLKLLKGLEGESKAVILMTDGVNNAGRINPIKAAQVAKDLSIPVHTIGIGIGEAPLGDQVLGGVLGLSFGHRAEFDEATLRDIAKTTGGVYFNAKSLDRLKEVYQEIEQLTETQRDERSQTIVEELFFPYAAAGGVMLVLLALSATTVFMKVP